MKTITLKRAQEIASQWHNGQGSALYSFASTGKFHVPYTLQYFKEIWSDIEPEYWSAREVTRSQKDVRELKSLMNYLLLTARQNGLSVEFHPAEVYGYQVPYLAEGVSEELAKQVNQVMYLK